ncbi:helix-turn-helix transcriptional regulator [Bacillus toyonensis]
MFFKNYMFTLGKRCYIIKSTKRIKVINMAKLNTQRAKQIRLQLGYSQEEVAKHLECTKGSYCQMELGYRQPSLEKLGRLSKLYKVSTDELLEIS